jgi:hypothetical protein
VSVIDTLIFDRVNRDLVDDTDKAYISYMDLNRIEQACQYVANELEVNVVTKTWAITEFRTDADMNRIKNNITILKNAYYNRPNTPVVPSVINFISIYQANNIEKILFDIDYMIQSVTSGLQRLSFKLGTKLLGNRR